jgi:hypothetical protein
MSREFRLKLRFRVLEQEALIAQCFKRLMPHADGPHLVTERNFPAGRLRNEDRRIDCFLPPSLDQQGG